jgi:hypothetical protein
VITRLTKDNSGRIALQPVRGSGPLRQKQGVWVFRTGQTLSDSATDKMLKRIREGRDLANLG